MTPLGLNLPGDPRCSVEEIAATGARLVRVPLRFSFDMRPFFLGCRMQGIKVMLVGDSHPDSLGTDEALWKYRIHQADYRYGDLVAYYVWGNEALAAIDSDTNGDGVVTLQERREAAPSSWVMTFDELNHLNAVAAEAQPHRQRWLAGDCSGRPDYLDQIDLSLVDGVCIHPYSKSPGSPELHDMLEDYLRYSRGLPICVTEYDSRTPGMSTYMAQDPRIAFALAFAYHDDVQGFGLVDQQGNKRPSYFEFQQATLAAPASSVPDTGGVTMPSFHLGFADKVAELGADVVGAPLEDETYITPNYSLQMTEKGLLIYSKAANRVQFLRAAS